MDAMLVGIFTGAMIYFFAAVTLLLTVYFIFLPAVLLRFLLMRRPVTRDEWKLILKYELIFYGSVYITWTLFSISGTDILTLIKDIVTSVPGFGAVFCLQWLILRYRSRKQK